MMNRNDYRHQGIDVAEDCGLLSRQAANGREVQAVVESGMDQADHRQADQSAQIQGCSLHGAAQAGVGDQHQGRRQKLKEGAGDAVDTANDFVEQDHRSIEDSGT